ncbi:hypothetical protein BJ508DRAFT_332774 [Ascobolus immersus RN42]|uniref:Uncharacterized protein n=1 Tax=Ascobolus immersus RN42 TaxID=1160509 RepID=A0A3N4HLL0_ASCIM|nr:hypothetical protein BJ508DRAFT_332774 [Ascobolus immersus RN42]
MAPSSSAANRLSTKLVISAGSGDVHMDPTNTESRPGTDSVECHSSTSCRNGALARLSGTNSPTAAFGRGCSCWLPIDLSTTARVSDEERSLPSFVDVYGYGEQAVCPLWGRHAFPQGSYLSLWFNALSYQDQLRLQVGDGIFRNWEYCLMMLRSNLDERLKTKAEGRKKRAEETYPQYLAETYPLLKAAYRTDTEAAIIQRLKAGFDSWDAFHAMSEEYNFQQLENQAHRYERMRGLFGALQRPEAVESSYLSIDQARSNALLFESAPESQSYAARSSYQQQPASAAFRAADPVDFVPASDIHPDIMVHRLTSVPDAEVDQRAKTVNKRPSAKDGGALIRSYIKSFPRKEVVFLARDCSICKQAGLQPCDHFHFEHNLYHTATSKTYVHQNGLPEVDQDSDSENDWEE